MRRVLKNLTIALGCLIVVGGCTEASLRLLGAEPEEPHRWGFSWVGKGEPWRLEPGTQFRTVRGGHQVSINSDGFRDREFLPARPGAFRILFLGDSVTFGHGVAFESTFARRLEGLLEGRQAPIRVLNAAIPGWSTHQEWLFYRDESPRLAPDLVLVGFVLNDVTEVQRGLLEIDLRRGFLLARGINWLAQQSATIALIKSFAAALLKPEELAVEQVEHLTLYPDAPNVKRALQRIAETLLEIAELAHARGDGFGLVLFPFQYQVRGENRDTPQRTLQASAEAHGIPVLDLQPLLEEYPPAEIFLDADHLTPRGHEVVADAIAAWLEQEALLPGSVESPSPSPR